MWYVLSPPSPSADGAQSVSNLRNKQLWILYLKLPIAPSRQAREQNRLRREVLELKRDMNNTSSQDEFAKWAKLRRRHDKSLEEFEAASAFNTKKKKIWGT